jgi:Ca-activated chloride channel homolog
VLELQQKPHITPPIEDPVAEIPPTLVPDPTVEISVELPETKIESLEATLETELEEEITDPTSDLDKNNFDESNFNPVNVTFVLDVSASMSAGKKMELLKFSLNQLTDMLRAQDKITLVTYSTNTQVILPTTSGSNKEEIKNIVADLHAGGLTAGGAGIKMGYKQTLGAYILDGTNHVFVITDGAFNRNSDDYKKYIKRYKKKGINMSIVGILNKERDKIEMEEVAQLAGGNYIPVFKLADAMNNLKQEIRYLSFKR